jgi:hypothetical protein
VVLVAYKRYIHKKGKRHGPYFYKNVRDDSGNVKSVYLGKVTTRGKKPLEVTIVFLTALLIIISTLFFLQHRNLVLGKSIAEETQIPFEIDQILLKVLVKSDEYIEKELRIMNVNDNPENISVEIEGVNELIQLKDRNFILKPGQTKVVRLNFTSFNSEESIEQAPGVYIGKAIAKSARYSTEVPIVVEIESRNVLFDMNLNPVARDRRIAQGESTTFEIRVFNLKSIESYNVGMDFLVKDINGNTIVSERESVVVKTQASFFKTLKIPETLKAGNYVFVAQTSLGNSVGTSSYIFEVESKQEDSKFFDRFIGFCKNDPLCMALSAIVLLLIFTIGAYSYFYVGALIYKIVFGVKVIKSRSVPANELQQGIRKNPIIESVTDVFRSIKRSNEDRLKKKLELEKGRFELQQKKERMKIELKEKERRLREEAKEEKELEIKSREDERLRKLEEKKKYEIEKNLTRAQKIAELTRKKEEEKELRRKEFERKEKEREWERKKKLEESKRKSEEEKRKKIEALKEKESETRKKIFEFFHGIGLVKTEKEKEFIRKSKFEIEQRKKSELEKAQKYLELQKKAKKLEQENVKIRYEKRRKAEEEEKIRAKEEYEKRKKATEEEKRKARDEDEKRRREESIKNTYQKRKQLELHRKKSKKEFYYFLHKIGLVKTRDEIQKDELEKLNLNQKREKAKLELEKAREEIRKKRLSEKEKELELKKKLQEQKEKEKSSRSGMAGKCRILIDKGYKALENDDIAKADTLYVKLINKYSNLPNERKTEIFKETNSFYKSLLLRKHQLKEDQHRRKEEEEQAKKLLKEQERVRKKEEEKRKRKEASKRAKEFDRRKNEISKEVFNTLHNIGLAKTKEERDEDKKLKELEKSKKLEQAELIKKEQERLEIQKSNEKQAKKAKIAKDLSQTQKKLKEVVHKTKIRIHEHLHDLGIIQTKEEKRKHIQEKKKKEIAQRLLLDSTKKLEQEERSRRLEEQKKREIEAKNKQAELKKKEEDKKKEEENKQAELKKKEIERKQKEESIRKREAEKRLEIEKKKQERARTHAKRRQEEAKKRLTEFKEFGNKAKVQTREFLHDIGILKSKSERAADRKIREEEARKKKEEYAARKLQEQKINEQKAKEQAEIAKKLEVERKREKEEKNKQAELKKKEIERKKEIEKKEKRAMELETQRLKLLDEERKRKGEEKRKLEELKAAQEEAKIKKLEEETRKREEEETKKKKEIEAREIARSKEEKRLEYEQKRKQEEKLRLKELKVKEKEALRKQQERIKAEKKAEEARRRKELQEKMALEAISKLEISVGENESNLTSISKNIESLNSKKQKFQNEISGNEGNIDSLKEEKENLFRIFSESTAQRKQIREQKRSKRDEWKGRYDAKTSEKTELKSQIKEEYESELKLLESELKDLKPKDRVETRKWKRMQLRAKYKLQEKEREKVLAEELKSLLIEKKDIDNESIKDNKQITHKDMLIKQKELDDHIRDHEIAIRGIKSKIEQNENDIRKIERKRELIELQLNKDKSALSLRKKNMGGIHKISAILGVSLQNRIHGLQQSNIKKNILKIPNAKDLISKTRTLLAGKTSSEDKIKTSLRELEKKSIKNRTESSKEYSKDLSRCRQLIDQSQESIQNKEMDSAKEIYLQAREAYIKLEYEEKKEVYDDLNNLYNQISK